MQWNADSSPTEISKPFLVAGHLFLLHLFILFSLLLPQPYPVWRSDPPSGSRSKEKVTHLSRVYFLRSISCFKNKEICGSLHHKYSQRAEQWPQNACSVKNQLQHHSVCSSTPNATTAPLLAQVKLMCKSHQFCFKVSSKFSQIQIDSGLRRSSIHWLYVMLLQDCHLICY